MSYGYEENGVDVVVGTTLPTLDLFRGYKNGDSAFYLFFQYLRQSRIQDTKETFSLDKFMMKACWWEWKPWSEGKFRKAKWVLLELWMIKSIKKLDEQWRIKGHYVGIYHKYRIGSNTITSKKRVMDDKPIPSKNHAMEKPSPGKNGVLNAPVVKTKNATIVKKKNAPLVTTDLSEEEKFNFSEALRIASWFWEERCDEPINVHWIKKKWEKKFKNDWIDGLLELNRLDGYNWTTIELSLKFGLQDSRFWRWNLISLCGLRKKMKNGIPKFVWLLQWASTYIELEMKKKKKSGSGRSYASA